MGKAMISLLIDSAFALAGTAGCNRQGYGVKSGFSEAK